MPDRAFPKLHQPACSDFVLPQAPARHAGSQGICYAELHCLTNFSFLEGASHPDELVLRAASLGCAALAITDKNSLAGVVRAHVAAKQVGLKLLVGSEITPTDAPPIVLWAMDRVGYGQLARLITIGRRRAEKGQCELSLADIAGHARGLLAGILLTSRGEVSPGALLSYREIFGNRLYGLIELHRGPDDRQRLQGWIQLARQAHVPLAAANDVHYHVPSRRRLQDLLTAVRHHCLVAEAGSRLWPNGERHLKSPQQMATLFARYPELLRHTTEIAEKCHFCLDELCYEYPEELCPEGQDITSYLSSLTWKGAARRYPQGIPEKVQGLILHELELIKKLRYEAYFLTVYDLVRFARKQGILCQGRGSAANSVVCYCLGVTSVDPEQIDVLFERFISQERNEAPDIDVDFEHHRREEVLQYIYQKYSRERTGMTAEVITYRPRSAVRDIGKALGLSLERIDTLSKLMNYVSIDAEGLALRCQEAGLDPQTAIVRQFMELVLQLLGFPRHLGQHVGGMVMTRGPLCELVPIENAAMPGRTVIQWDKDDLDSLGILKVDCLALGMLTVIHKAFDLIEKHTGKHYTLATVPSEVPEVYQMVSRADTVGVFQIESRAQMTMLPRLRPRCFYDLVIEVAIVRPGPIQGKMVHPYLKRRRGEEAITYPNEAIRKVLEKTLGVPLFQEQAMRLAVVAAGFTPGEADQLRRAIAAWKRPGVIDQFRQKLITGMLERGLSEDFAERIFQQLQGFGQYGFPESHAASFALLVYVSAWLKCFHPDAFVTALLNSQPMGFYAPAQLIRDARDHGVQVRAADVNASGWDCRLEPAESAGTCAVRLGLRLVKGVSEVHARRIEEARSAGPFRSWYDFLRRTQLPRGTLVRLARGDVFASLGLSRRQALWQTLSSGPTPPLFGELEEDSFREDLPEHLPEMTLGQQITSDYQTTGFSLRAHPLSLLRERLQDLDVHLCCQTLTLANGRRVRLAGLVLFRQRPSTAKGITFLTIEDETGIANLIIRPDVWERFSVVARTARILLVEGKLERADGITHVLVSRLEDLSARLHGLNNRSRDFR